MAWRVETIRASVFVENVEALHLPDWQAVVGAAPERIVNNPQANQVVESGLFTGHLLTIGTSQQMGRADFVWTSPQRALLTPMAQPPSIGDFTTSLFARFVELAKKWASPDINIQRLALACTLWEPAITVDDALSIILSKVPSFRKSDNERITDFLIQLNRPRQSKVNSEISINRLAQWSARIVELISFPAKSPIPQPPTVHYPRAQLDLDINTSLPGPILSRRVTDHLTELGELLIEIAEKGDTP